MKISILMPIYNGIEFFKESFRTISRQTHTDWELLIGINGHSDPSFILGLIEEIAKGDPRVRVFVQTTTGKPNSLNDLMTHVTTDWVALLDVDDTWSLTKLEEQVRILATLHPETAVVGTFCHYFGELSGSPTIPSGYIDPKVLASVNPIINSSSLIRRELCRWTSTYDVEDYELWMKIALSGKKLYNIPKDLVGHRVHRQSAFNGKQQDVEQLRKHFMERRI
jgi:glycosyltransferase involved in cell wall biosynthesis